MTPEIRVKNLAEILKELEQKEGLNSYAKVGRAYDINASYLSQLLNGTRTFGEKAARNIEEKLGLAKFQLDASDRSVNNGIAIGGSNTNTGVQIGQTQGVAHIHGYSAVSDWDDSTPVDVDEVEMTFYKSLGFACGHGAEGEAFSNEWRKLRFSRMTLERLGIYPDQAFAATAHDDSMTPTICDGDTIFVDRGRNKIKDGRIFAIEHGGLFYCKRLYNLPNGGVRIVSDNGDEFPERSLSRGELEAEGFSVIGWVFSVSRLERW